MITVPPELENVPVTIVFEGVAEDLTAGLRAEFTDDEEDVIYSHGFSGAGALLVAASLTTKTLEKLITFWEKVKIHTPNTSIKIARNSVSLNGFSREDAIALLESPGLRDAVRAARKK